MGNIIHMWGSPHAVTRSGDVQLELFDSVKAYANLIAFIDITDFDQNQFLDIIAKNSVKSILDIRPRPVFRRPKFSHGEMSEYFEWNRINYFEYAIFGRSEDVTRVQIARKIHSGRSDGLSLCIFDEESKTRGWLEEARFTLHRSRLFKAELNSRSLV